MKCRLGTLLFFYVLFAVSWLSTDLANAQSETPLRVMTWNIWRGGREDGETEGPQRVIDVIRASKADIVAMQETYGSGKIISKGLGFHFQERGTNLSIHSRYEIVEDISVFEPFKCTGALIQMPGEKQIAFYCIWLPYGEDIWLPNVRDGLPTKKWLAACQPSANDLTKIVAAIQKRLNQAKYDNVSVMIAGDFNSMSHMDYREANKEQFGKRMRWPTSKVMTDAGFRDSFREVQPHVNREQDSTWSPKFPKQEQDRIDFVYYRSPDFRASEARVIRQHPTKFPSDHAAVLIEFQPEQKLIKQQECELKAISYNIRRGMGLDNQTNLTRTTNWIRQQSPDFVGLQEIDLKTKRSGQVNQIVALGKDLNMHPAFGKFMDYQGGEYGLGILSRHPIVDVQQIQLPKGNEPRVALAATVQLPNDRRVMVVNLHFDWVKDDKYRLAQAKAVKTFLDEQTLPFLLLGDFNDVPGSRTIALFDKTLTPAIKPEGNRNTYPALKPTKEIDYIYTSGNPWRVNKTYVTIDSNASDHCPVITELTLLKEHR